MIKLSGCFLRRHWGGWVLLRCGYNGWWAVLPERVIIGWGLMGNNPDYSDHREGDKSRRPTLSLPVHICCWRAVCLDISKAVKRGALKGIRSGRASPMLSHFIFCWWFIALFIYLFYMEATNQKCGCREENIRGLLPSYWTGGQHGEVFTRVQ